MRDLKERLAANHKFSNFHNFKFSNHQIPLSLCQTLKNDSTQNNNCHRRTFFMW